MKVNIPPTQRAAYEEVYETYVIFTHVGTLVGVQLRNVYEHNVTS